MHDPEPTGFERRLARLRPAAVPLDRDRMLYEAGRAAALAGSRDRAWLATASALALIALALVGLLARERGERRALEVALAAKAVEAGPPRPPIAAPSRAIEPGSYLALRREILAGRPDPPPGAETRPDDPDAPAPLRVRGRAVDL